MKTTEAHRKSAAEQRIAKEEVLKKERDSLTILASIVSVCAFLIVNLGRKQPSSNARLSIRKVNDKRVCPRCARQIPDHESVCVECSSKFTIRPNELKERKSFLLQIISIMISVVALSISVTVAYLQNRVDHDLVARVLKASFYPGRDAELYVEVGLINRGNQAEIVREMNIKVSDTEEALEGYSKLAQVVNRRIEKGDKQVMRASITNFLAFDGKHKWLSVTIMAIAPDASDI